MPGATISLNSEDVQTSEVHRGQQADLSLAFQVGITLCCAR